MTMVNDLLNKSPFKGKLTWALNASPSEFEFYVTNKKYEPQEEDEEKNMAYVQKFSGLTRKEQKESLFEKLEIKSQNEAMIKRAMSWDFTKDKKGFLIIGPTGVGKTALSKCLINKWGSKGHRCKLITMVDILEHLKGIMNEKSTSIPREQEILASFDILVIDDLGAEMASEWALTQIFTLINARYENEKHTFITTNLPPDNLKEKYGARIFDRLINMCEKHVIYMESFRGRR